MINAHRVRYKVKKREAREKETTDRSEANQIIIVSEGTTVCVCVV